MLELKKNRMLTMDEKDVTTVLTLVNGRLRYDSMRVGNCGSAEEPDKWFVTFDAKEKTFGKLIKDLQKIGNVKVDVQCGKVEFRFERA